jgi:hypothetical protein
MDGAQGVSSRTPVSLPHPLSKKLATRFPAPVSLLETAWNASGGARSCLRRDNCDGGCVQDGIRPTLLPVGGRSGGLHVWDESFFRQRRRHL